MIGALLGLAQFAPAIISLFDSDDKSTAAKAAKAVSETARAITGSGSDDDALAALKTDPEKMLAYQAAINAHAATMYASETKRLIAINETIRREAASSDRYVRRWRPTMGYAVTFSWMFTVLAIVYAIIATPEQAPAVIASVGSLSSIWTVALAVLGLSVHKRSQDKQPPRTGALSTLVKRLTQ